jgi:alpha,alpha-trehalase
MTAIAPVFQSRTSPLRQFPPAKPKLRFGEQPAFPALSPLSDLPTPAELRRPAQDYVSWNPQPLQSPASEESPPINPVLKAYSGQQIMYPIAPVLDYIKRQWTNLQVTNSQLLDVMQDPKVKLMPGEPMRLYMSAQENPQTVWNDLQKALPPQSLQKIQLVILPPAGMRNSLPPGLLYLPHPYVVPGGRFKEMYGWDSYFIQLGLLKDGKLQAAKDMTDNHLYEIEKYGTILNANRSYFINRSQPPFISQMVLNVYKQTGDKAWLQKALPSVEKHYAYWTTGGHIIPSGPAAGLSRYFAYGEGPALEVVQGEVENGKNHYDKIKEFYRTHPVPDYDVNQYYDAKTDQLTPAFYKADRTMRESGFDPSNRFGPFNIDITNYVPVCLNSLLYKMEKDMAEMYKTLDNPTSAAHMDKMAENRKDRMNRVLWSDRHGMYQDYNFKTDQQRHYPYATMFFPMWAGVASPQQAQKTMQNLPVLEAPGGLMTSSTHSGNQWDAPFAWAPLQDIAVKGLLNYDTQVPGAKDAAVRLSNKFVNTVAKEFGEEHGIFEKYDARRMENDVANGIDFGYDSNEPGFGWTNGTFLELLDVLKQNAAKPPVQQPSAQPQPAGPPAQEAPTSPATPSSQAPAGDAQNPFRMKPQSLPQQAWTA